MRAILVRPDRSLAWEELPPPPCPPGCVRVRVRATAVNRADLLQREGRYPPPPGASPILGLECAGEVVEVGPGADARLGDRVAALLAGGGYAEEAVCPAAHTLPVPDGMPWAEAAALPEVLTTAWLNVWLEAGARPGEAVLLHAGASGVGTAAIQLCRERGNPCHVTVGSDEKLAACVALGAAGGAVRGRERFAELVPAWTSGRGADVILDPVGGPYLEDDLRCLATDGRLVIIGLMGGRTATLDLGRLLVKRLRVVGSTLRSRSDADKARILGSLREEVWPLVAAGRVRAVLDRALPIARVEEAHALLAADRTVGKVALLVG